MTTPDALTVLRDLRSDVESKLSQAKTGPGRVGFSLGLEDALESIYSQIARLEREQAEAHEPGDFIIRAGDYKP